MRKIQLLKRPFVLLLSLALLVSFMVPAGLISAAEVATGDTPTASDGITRATKYDFSSQAGLYLDGAAYYPGTNVQIVLRFEYYLPKVPSSLFVYDSQNHATLTSGDNHLYAGYHQFEATYTVSSSVVLFRLFNAIKDVEALYIWNISLTKNGTQLTPSSVTSTPTGVADQILTTYDWYTTRTSPVVSELDLHQADADKGWGLGYFVSGAADSTQMYEFSFDYYLEEDATTLTFDSLSSYGTATRMALDKTAGHHTYAVRMYSTHESDPVGQLVPRLMCDKKVYIWNFKATLNGENAFIDYTKGGAPSYLIKSTSGKPLADYDWYADTNNDPAVTEIDFTRANENYTGTSTTTTQWIYTTYQRYALTEVSGHTTAFWVKNADGAVQNALQEWSVSFDYYLPSESTVTVSAVGGGMTNIVTNLDGNSRVLPSGAHSFKLTCNSSRSNAAFAPSLVCSSADTKFYLWNYSVKVNGFEVNSTAGRAYAYCTADDTTVNPLTSYAWSEHLDDEDLADEVFVLRGSELTKDIMKYNSAGTVAATSITSRTLLYDGGLSATAKSTKTWVLSFDYYMPEASPIYLLRAEGGYTLKDDATNSPMLQQGRHTFTCTFVPNDINTSVSVNANAGTTPGFGYYYHPSYFESPSDVYIWDVRLGTTDGTVTKTFGSGSYSGYLSNNALIDTAVYGDVVSDFAADQTAVTTLDFTNVASVENGGGANPFVLMAAHRTVDPAYAYEVSFDYYLPTANTRAGVLLDSAYYTNAHGTSMILNTADGEERSYYLAQGRHHFRGTIADFNVTNNMSLTLKLQMNQQNGYVLSRLYVWNVSVVPLVKADGTPANNSENYVYGRRWMPYSEGTAATESAVAAATLTPPSELNTVDAQYVDARSLRFFSVVECVGVEQEADAAVDYSGGRIMINGVAYPMTGAGTVYAYDRQLSGVADEALRLGQTNVYSVAASELLTQTQMESYAPGMQGVLFAGTVTGIPREDWEQTISARAYVTYLDECGQEQTLYGNVLSCSVTQAKEREPIGEQSSRYDTQADAMRESIVGAANADYSSAVGAVYYVSPNGDDAADGTSPDTAWKTLDKVNALSNGTSSAPQVVLFERGGLWRGSVQVRSYTTYGAYGVGEKPRFYGSLQNYADPELWVPSTTYENVWELDVSALGEFTHPDTTSEWGNDIGNVFFIDYVDGEEKVQRYSEKMLDLTLLENYQFYHDQDNGKLYLYLETEDGQTPADMYDSIEIASRFRVFARNNAVNPTLYNVTVENLCIKYTGSHGIGFGDWSHNITIRNCEIGWIGGSMHSGTTRFGNGIEFYGRTSHVLVEDNWIYQCFDAGYTNQGSSSSDNSFIFTQEDIVVQDNLIEYCCYSIEVWNAPRDLMKDCTYQNNLLRFAGYNFERDNRMSSSLRVSSHFNFFYAERNMENVVVKDNILDTAYCHLVAVAYPNDAQGKGPIITNNTYVQSYDRLSSVAYCWDINNPTVVPETTYYADSQAQMEASVALIDTDPTAVYYDG